jgi:hypothetical protein
VGLLDAGAGAEMSLGLAHGGSSKKESVRAYYNYIYNLERERDKEQREEGVLT